MRKRENFFVTFFLFLFLSVLLFFLFSLPLFNGLTGFLEVIVSPFQHSAKTVFSLPADLLASKKLQQLQEENITLRKKIVDQKNLLSENSALKDQFQTTFPTAPNLLPAYVVGFPVFIPGVSLPEEIVINKGEKEGVQKGHIVVVKDNVIGKIIKTSSHLSVVQLVTNTASSVAAVEQATGALGVIKGQGSGELILDNILLSEKLTLSDTVVTNGDVDAKGKGYPAGLILGKIVSIDKKPSALFQTAKVESFVDFSKLRMVFILMTHE